MPKPNSRKWKVSIALGALIVLPVVAAGSAGGQSLPDNAAEISVSVDPVTVGEPFTASGLCRAFGRGANPIVRLYPLRAPGVVQVETVFEPTSDTDGHFALSHALPGSATNGRYVVVLGCFIDDQGFGSGRDYFTVVGGVDPTTTSTVPPTTVPMSPPPPLVAEPVPSAAPAPAEPVPSRPAFTG